MAQPYNNRGGHRGQGGGSGGQPRPVGNNPPTQQSERVEIMDCWADRDAINPALFRVQVRVQVAMGRQTLVRPVVLMLNGLARNDATAMDDTDNMDGQTVLSTLVDPSPTGDGDPMTFTVRIQHTVITSQPRRLRFQGGPVQIPAQGTLPKHVIAPYPEGIAMATHQIPVSLTDDAGLPTSGTVTATHAGGSAPYVVSEAGVLVPVTVPDGETQTVQFTCPGAAPATVTLKGKDKVATKALNRVDVNQTGVSFDETTGHTHVLVTPRGFDEDGKGVAFELMLTFEKVVGVVKLEGGVETELAAATLQVVIPVDAKPKATYRLTNSHEELIETDINAIGIYIEINNMQLPAARRVAGKLSDVRSLNELGDFFSRGGVR